ncbi:DUF3012 domain-containing protein [Vibrio aestuarianus]|uniref:DUF3012 domain-containing protein n=1 Tax=Vibrio aestuarianus TaxID=28171 RepID=UPI003B96B93C
MAVSYTTLCCNEPPTSRLLSLVTLLRLSPSTFGLSYAKHCVIQSQIGSTAWCKDMEDKPKGDWTANEAGDFAKHCIF